MQNLKYPHRESNPDQTDQRIGVHPTIRPYGQLKSNVPILVLVAFSRALQKALGCLI